MVVAAFNASYYSTVAQVIPVFLIFVLATRFFRDKAASALPLQLNLLLVVTVLTALWAEASALTALRDEKAPSGLEDMVIIWAIVLPMLFIVAESLIEPATAILRDLPAPLKRYLDWGGKALVVGLVPALAFGLNVPAIVAGILVALLALAFVLPFGTEIAQVKRRRQSKSDDRPAQRK